LIQNRFRDSVGGPEKAGVEGEHGPFFFFLGGAAPREEMEKTSRRTTTKNRFLGEFS
jgi:hypothetical protein